MSGPPIPIPEINESILTAIREFDWQKARPVLAELVGNTPAYMERHFALEHTIPSPSGVLTCRRQLWYKSHGIEGSSTKPESWSMRAAAGMVMEPWWFMILSLADPRLKVTSRDEILDITPDVGGSCDGYLDEIDALLELKSQTGWKFIFNNDKGIESESPEHIAQCQLYMHGAKREWCLFVASAADPSLVRWVKNRKKDPAFEYPFFLLEWVHYDRERTEELVERLGMILEDKETEEPAAREYNPQTTKWPCQLGCRWRGPCEEIG